MTGQQWTPDQNPRLQGSVRASNAVTPAAILTGAAGDVTSVPGAPGTFGPGYPGPWPLPAGTRCRRRSVQATAHL